ncbi:MAG: hypothetical protein KDK00_04625 [Rhodobacteraceae bacterium]|nr:hypothetical protein [Paracoccaceae bacterium]
MAKRQFCTYFQSLKLALTTALMISIAQASSAQESGDGFSKSEYVLFGGAALTIYAPANGCTSTESEDYLVVTDAPLDEKIIESFQFRTGPIAEVFKKKVEACIANRIGMNSRRLATSKFNPQVAFYVASMNRPYAYGKFTARGMELLSNVSIHWRSGSMPDFPVDEAKVAQIIEDINVSAKRQHVLSGAADHIQKQVLNLLEDNCRPGTPFTMSGFVPYWEKNRCVLRTVGTSSLRGLHLFHWSAESRVVSCSDDLSSCDYEFQFICNQRERGGGYSELCGIPRSARGTPVQKGTLRLSN